ncbi:MAG TPA: DUF5709 domain-containing protein [Actinospica sp.]|jgi:hypothetical protein|nr:DUF5709 domain-containing protein [Actinospica sp.]
MADASMGDDVYQPTGGNEEQADAAPLDLEDALDEDGLDELLDKGYSPPERPLASNKVGITAAEQREGETLDQRLAQEVPDVTAQPAGADDGLGDDPDSDGELIDSEAGEPRAGRLVSPDFSAESNTDDLVADDVGIDGAAASAEEAAVHVVEDPEAPNPRGE